MNATPARRADPPAFGLPGRIQAPNSLPRSIALVGLGEGGAAIARNVAGQGLARVEVHVLAKSALGGDALAAIKAGGGDLQRGLTGADMIFIVACAGDDVGGNAFEVTADVVGHFFPWRRLSRASSRG